MAGSIPRGLEAAFSSVPREFCAFRPFSVTLQMGRVVGQPLLDVRIAPGVQRVEFTELLMSTYCMCVVTLGTTMLSEQKPPGREEATDPSLGRQSGSGQVLAEQGEGGPGEPPTSSLGRPPVLGAFSRWERQRGG